jgi:hypothetical protein
MMRMDAEVRGVFFLKSRTLKSPRVKFFTLAVSAFSSAKIRGNFCLEPVNGCFDFLCIWNKWDNKTMLQVKETWGDKTNILECKRIWW